MAVKLRYKHNVKEGSWTPYLSIYENEIRRYEFLTHLKDYRKKHPYDPKNLPTPSQQTENVKMALKIMQDRSHALATGSYDIKIDTSKKVLVIPWMQSYLDHYPKSDKRNMVAVFGRFVRWLEKRNIDGLVMKNFNKAVAVEFKAELETTCKGEGARSYWSRFAKMVNAAVAQELLLKNPCQGVKAPDGRAVTRATLDQEEIERLENTPTNAAEVRKAALFTLNTGLAWVDVKALTWAKVHIEKKFIEVVRAKEAKYNTQFEIPLNSKAIALMGEPGKPNAHVFNLPTADGANASLKDWLIRAKITKKITWHNLRHTYGKRLGDKGVDIYVISRVMGHSSLKYTAKYVRPNRENNLAAVEKLLE